MNHSHCPAPSPEAHAQGSASLSGRAVAAEIDQYLAQIKNLPLAPDLLRDVLGELRKPNADTARIEQLILHDPALTANVLRLCNSAFLASSTPVTHLQEAILRLGLEPLYSLVAVASIARGLSPKSKGAKNRDHGIWTHSVATAFAAEVIARDLGQDERLLFTAGLLHDLGKTVLAEALKHDYTQICEEATMTLTPLVDAEKAAFGVDHAEVGGRLLERWGFPADLVHAVHFHHRPAAAGAYQTLAAQVQLADTVACQLGYSCATHLAQTEADPASLAVLNLPGDSLPDVVACVQAKLATIKALLQAAN